jgi:hypothetical protein
MCFLQIKLFLCSHTWTLNLSAYEDWWLISLNWSNYWLGDISVEFVWACQYDGSFSGFTSGTRGDDQSICWKCFALTRYLPAGNGPATWAYCWRCHITTGHARCVCVMRDLPRVHPFVGLHLCCVLVFCWENTFHMNLYYSTCITDTVSAFALWNMAYYWHSFSQSCWLLRIASHYSSVRGVKWEEYGGDDG